MEKITFKDYTAEDTPLTPKYLKELLKYDFNAGWVAPTQDHPYYKVFISAQLPYYPDYLDIFRGKDVPYFLIEDDLEEYHEVEALYHKVVTDLLELIEYGKTDEEILNESSTLIVKQADYDKVKNLFSEGTVSRIFLPTQHKDWKNCYLFITQNLSSTLDEQYQLYIWPMNWKSFEARANGYVVFAKDLYALVQQVVSLTENIITNDLPTLNVKVCD